jgi:GH35 family endo-1,4-beta-xylanase
MSAKTHALLGLLVCFHFITPLAPGATPVEPPPGGEDWGAPADAMAAWADAAVGTAEKLPDGGWRLVVKNADANRAFAAQCVLPVTGGAITKGDRMLALIKARVVGQPRGLIEAKLQLSSEPFTGAAPQVRIDLTPEWTEYPALMEVSENLTKGAANLSLFCGHMAQTVEIASIQLLRYGPQRPLEDFPRIRRSYAGREPGAPWRKAALERIERERKQELAARFTTPDGKPLAHAKVKLTLRRHAFGFGSAVPAWLMTDDSADGRRFREIIDEYFSVVVFENDFKDGNWSADIDPDRMQQRRAQLDQAFAWFAERNIAVRGHYLMQVPVPYNLEGVTDDEAIRRHYLESTRKRIEFAGRRVCEWDVINHPAAWAGADMLTARPALRTIDREVFKLARSLTDLPMVVNEDHLFGPGSQGDETYHYIAALQRDGYKVDALGNQAHLKESFLPSPEEVLAFTDRFAAIVPRQIITEFDVFTVGDEELAADYTRDLLIAVFSHPAYSGFLWWGFWEGSHWQPSSASWNKDWSIRQRGEVLREWLGKHWRTEVELTTDENGLARWRGFPGHYDAAANGRRLAFQSAPVANPATITVPGD